MRGRGTGAQIAMLAAVASLAASHDAGGQTTEDLARAGSLVQDAFAARESGDLEAYRDRLVRAATLRPRHPELIYYIAGSDALLGHADRAITGLERVAEMGLALGAGSDPDFASLAGDPRFQAVARRLDENREPRGVSRTAFVVRGEPGFVPEGLAYDPRDGSFYLGSVHQRKILRIDGTGSVFEFAAPGFRGLMSAMGMLVDADEGVLWVCTAGMPETRGLSEADLGRSAVFKFDLETGALLLTHHFSNSQQERIVGDLALAPDGELYVSDARGSGIHRIRAGGDFLETFVQPSVFRSPQGLAISADGRGLYAADYSRGLFYVHRDTREVTPLVPPENHTLLGIDGLARDGNALMAIQNGTSPHRILRVELSDDGRRIRHVRVLASNLPEWDEPTLGVMAEGRFYYVANSHWNRFDDGRLPDDLSDPRVMWLDPRR